MSAPFSLLDASYADLTRRIALLPPKYRRIPPDDLVAKRVDQMMEVAAQVPEYVIEDMEDTADHKPADGELVGLIRRDGRQSSNPSRPGV